MVTTITQTTDSSDLLAYIESYTASANAPANPYGSFNPSTVPYDQWVRGTATDTYTAVLDGDFTGYTQGNLQGTAESLTFGTGLTYNSTTGLYAVSDVDLTLDFNGYDTSGSTTDNFDWAIYGLMTNDPSNLYTFLAETGTEQVGTTGDDNQYSFGGDDEFTGNGGADYFTFDLARTESTVVGDDTITDFDVSDDVIEFALGDTAYDSYAEIIAATSDSSAGAVIDLGDYGTITLTDVTVASLSEDSFAFA